jgi:hypothetical protein
MKPRKKLFFYDAEVNCHFMISKKLLQAFAQIFYFSPTMRSLPFNKPSFILAKVAT